ncbi:hypothetical protein SAMN05444722_2289 [Rhodovulum sp. ES.010]|nr:hypothetical protein SAMN05444722_2289 [Rhodovulum sp. ES.010]
MRVAEIALPITCGGRPRIGAITAAGVDPTEKERAR